MRIGVLGTGMVGRTIGSKLVELGHEVRMGSRDEQHEGATSWASEAGEGASMGHFSGAAEFGEAVFNCTAGMHSVEALRAAGHTVYPVTLTGLGERVHLGGPQVNLDTHIADVVNLLRYEDLHEVVLAGHSYAGTVITGAADQAPERIARLV